MNVFLMYKIRGAVLANPEAFDMSYWDCGTSACIAGWTLRLSGEAKPHGGYDIGERAQKLLKISEEQAERLFDEDFWPEQFQTRCQGVVDDARLAAKRLDHFIKTEGRE